MRQQHYRSCKRVRKWEVRTDERARAHSYTITIYISMDLNRIRMIHEILRCFTLRRTAAFLSLYYAYNLHTWNRRTNSPRPRHRVCFRFSFFAKISSCTCRVNRLVNNKIQLIHTMNFPVFWMSLFSRFFWLYI